MMNNGSSAGGDEVMATTLTTPQTAAKAAAFAMTWQEMHKTLQQRMAPAHALSVESKMGPTVLAMCLGAIPIAQTIVVPGAVLEKALPPSSALAPSAGMENTNNMMMNHGMQQQQQQQQQQGGGMDSGKDPNKREKTVRVSFLILRVVDPGWSSTAAADQPAPNFRGGGGGGGGGKPLKEKKDKLVRFLPGVSAPAHGGRHLMVHTTPLLFPNGFQNPPSRGHRTEEYCLVSAGMIMSITVWGEDKVFTAFASQTADIQPFDLFFLELGAKSLDGKSPQSNESKLQIRIVTPLAKTLSAASFALVPRDIAAMSMDQAAAMKAHHFQGSHLTRDALDLRQLMMQNLEGGAVAGAGADAPSAVVGIDVPHGLKQEWIKGNLSSTIFFLRVTPRSGTIALGPDDILRYHGPLPLNGGLHCDTLVLQYDAHQFPSRDWTIKLFNIALLAGALELLVIVDTYAGSDGGREPSFHAYARIHHPALTALMLRRPPLAEVPHEIVAAFHAQRMAPSLKHLAVYPLSEATAAQERAAALLLAATRAVEEEPMVDSEAITATDDDATASPCTALVPAHSLEVSAQPPPLLNTWLALDVRKLTRRTPPSSSSSAPTTAREGEDGAAAVVTTPPPVPQLLSAFVPNDAVWESGHNVHVFVEGRLVFHFIAPVSLPGCRPFTNTSAFETISIPQVQGDVDVEDDDDDDDAAAWTVAKKPKEDEKLTTTTTPTTMAAETEAEQPNQRDAQGGETCAAAAAGKANKRKRATVTAEAS